MKTNTVLPLISLLALASARPMAIGTAINKREVPQEHSHEQFLDTVRTSLNTNNPAAITDPVFGLLGDAVCNVLRHAGRFNILIRIGRCRWKR